MLSINTNLPSIIAQDSLKTSTNKLNTAIERMTTGFKINSAKDNAANYSICTNMSTKIGAYQVAEDNVAMGIDLLNTASGGLDLIGDKLARLRALQEQAANGTYGNQSLKAINTEACAIVDEIERLYSTAEFNGINVYQDDTPQAIHNAVIPEDAVSLSEQVINYNNFEKGKTYTISNLEEFICLKDMVNARKSTEGVTFVLTSDIDLSSIDNFEGIGSSNMAFTGTFDGNGYTIKNVKISKNSRSSVGLFGFIGGATIKNLEVVNCDIVGGDRVGGLVGEAQSSTIENCHVTGRVETLEELAGGLVGFTGSTKISNSSAKTSIVAENVYVPKYLGGLVGINESGNIDHSYAISDFKLNCVREIGGLAGGSAGGSITNCFANIKTVTNDGTIYIPSNDYERILVGNNSSAITNSSYLDISDIYNPSILSSYGFTEENGWYTKDGALPSRTPYAKERNFTFQVGINGNDSSRIDLSTGFKLQNLSSFRQIGLNNTNCLSQIDEMISNITQKQTEYGAAQNRLESALDEIGTQYENLVASRSTLKDADISQVSSEYIKQQILQQASATLLSTANQSPALALQLI